jgi:acetylglutamate kinase
MITVIKIGGNIIDDEILLKKFLSQLNDLPGKKILVHGGGKTATTFAKQSGLETEMINGRRVTNAETLKVITMVYAGLVNKNIVALLQSLKCNAIGLSGVDGNLIRSEKRSTIPNDYGFVGDPLQDEINTALLLNLLNANYIPVITPITHDGNGQLLNTNADTIASVIAIALSEKEKVQLLFCFEKDGVLENPIEGKSFFSELKSEQTEQLTTDGIINSGMLPKLKAGFSAKQKGVHRVAIGNALKLSSWTNENKSCTLLEN